MSTSRYTISPREHAHLLTYQHAVDMFRATLPFPTEPAYFPGRIIGTGSYNVGPCKRLRWHRMARGLHPLTGERMSTPAMSAIATCQTCGQYADDPRIRHTAGRIVVEACVDVTHAPHIAPGTPYAAWVARARRAGISGRV
jgi:hypothetical protein